MGGIPGDHVDIFTFSVKKLVEKGKNSLLTNSFIYSCGRLHNFCAGLSQKRFDSFFDSDYFIGDNARGNRYRNQIRRNCLF
jgi:hypothetical protein